MLLNGSFSECDFSIKVFELRNNSISLDRERFVSVSLGGAITEQ